MSNTSLDASGVLLFDGPARVTPVIQMLFRFFHIGAVDSGHNDRCYIDVRNDGYASCWDRYLELLIDAVQGRISQIPTTDIFTILGRRYGADLQAFAASIQLDELVQIADVVRLALLLRDGHNLVGYSMQGARHGDGLQVGTFGGWATYVDARCSVHVSTDDICGFAGQLSGALNAETGAVATLIDEGLTRVINSIQDVSQRRDLKLRYALPFVDHPARTPSASQWERTIYVGAYATDEGDGPQWARLTVTPASIHRLQQLRGLCLAQGLSQIRLADAPERWGLDAMGNKASLSNCRLVVTPNAFYFTASPGRRSYSIETFPIAIDWFVSHVCGPGQPMCLRVDAGLILDET